jgi:hypothetical protein
VVVVVLETVMGALLYLVVLEVEVELNKTPRELLELLIRVLMVVTFLVVVEVLGVLVQTAVVMAVLE